METINLCLVHTGGCGYLFHEIASSLWTRKLLLLALELTSLAILRIRTDDSLWVVCVRPTGDQNYPIVIWERSEAG